MCYFSGRKVYLIVFAFIMSSFQPLFLYFLLFKSLHYKKEYDRIRNLVLWCCEQLVCQLCQNYLYPFFFMFISENIPSVFRAQIIFCQNIELKVSLRYLLPKFQIALNRVKAIFVLFSKRIFAWKRRDQLHQNFLYLKD